MFFEFSIIVNCLIIASAIKTLFSCLFKKASKKCSCSTYVINHISYMMFQNSEDDNQVLVSHKVVFIVHIFFPFPCYHHPQSCHHRHHHLQSPPRHLYIQVSPNFKTVLGCNHEK